MTSSPVCIRKANTARTIFFKRQSGEIELPHDAGSPVFPPLFLQRRCFKIGKNRHIVPNERGCYNLVNSEEKGQSSLLFLKPHSTRALPNPHAKPLLLQALISHMHGHILPRRRSWRGGSRTIRCCRNRRVSWQRGGSTRFRKARAVGR